MTTSAGPGAQYISAGALRELAAAIFERLGLPSPDDRAIQT